MLTKEQELNAIRLKEYVQCSKPFDLEGYLSRLPRPSRLGGSFRLFCRHTSTCQRRSEELEATRVGTGRLWYHSPSVKFLW